MSIDYNFPWRRYWHERSVEPTLDENGFLYSHYRASQPNLIQGIFHSTDLSDERCVIFLGEPSAGKSRTIGVNGIDRTELEDQASSQNEASLWWDLREIVVPGDLDQLRNSQTLKSW